MRRVFLLFVVALAFSITALAQAGGASAGSAGSASPTTKSSAAQTSQLTGCLAKDPNGKGYMLTNGHFKKGVAVQGKQDFSAHVGHTVMLTGMWQKPTNGAAAGTGDKGETMRTFEAASLKHIAASCPAAGAATAATTKAAPGSADTKKAK